MAIKPVVFNNTVLRDGHQSLAATRMRTEQMLPALEMLDSLGFGALETWGGATIDAGLRFLGEFPFDRLDAIKKGTPKTPHMMLLRGQNIVQYQNFPDDVVEAFVHTSAKHGMDVFRIFDALNDTRNIATAVRAAKAAGKHAQGVICYTTSPVHTTEKFIEMGREIEALGCDSICLKDMAGLIPPVACYQIVKGLKDNCKIPVIVHTHDTAGLGASTYYSAVEAGVDAIDTAISPFANGTGQPDTVRMLALLAGHPRCPSYDVKTLTALREHFTKVYGELGSFTSHTNEIVDTDTLTYQVPGGMLSNFRNQLKEQKMEDKFDDVFAEIPVVRKALGWIPLVTPTSQIVGVQAMLNVKFGRWKNFSPQAMDIALGYYGRTPAPVDPEVQKLAAEKTGKDPITVRPADLKKPGMAALRQELAAKGYPTDDEHCVIHAMFPQELEKYFAAKKNPSPAAAAPAAPVATKSAPVAAAATPSTAISTSAPSGEVGEVKKMILTIGDRRVPVTVETLA
ncbi:sodium-extruding oxaloacetate decarboxylase subunit alpha [Opitutales bacterium ASA1]|uniref:pyruvate carboxylase subunit B n=1 Tax=Congregicoccus parvus TaxID=3081749 RepID=UPI002B284C3E|nr:sodium-extruding oxaloacetate decarboxylase subunit alpha [Opitutales bacterium ASA1]